ncbi:MAG: hypothetical protein J0H86_12720 [Xanthomonadaceae bacterium]|nr:hypothetical protein [Xanthomonadaceae bacterium]ODU36046.1 MAG: hypothetical protein ABS97_01535 [Xanthomonadaceae bacterium SCN 69-320]
MSISAVAPRIEAQQRLLHAGIQSFEQIGRRQFAVRALGLRLVPIEPVHAMRGLVQAGADRMVQQAALMTQLAEVGAFVLAAVQPGDRRGFVAALAGEALGCRTVPFAVVRLRLRR